MSATLGHCNDLKRLARRWQRYATMERKLCDTTTNPDSKARSYGAWMAYRKCAMELNRLSESMK